MGIIFIGPSIDPKSQPKLISSFVYATFPTGIGFLAGYLREKNSAQVKILDDAVNLLIDSVLIEELENLEDPKIVGLSVLTVTCGRAYELAKKIKKIDSETTVILGGIHPTVIPEECLEKEGVDIVVRGEGERTLSELYDLIKDGKGYWSVKGISYKKDGKIIHNPDRELIPDLNEIPQFPYDLFNPEDYRDFGTIITSRGCPNSCIYCSQRAITGRKYRFLSTARVMEEIRLVVDKYGQKKIWFNDDNFATNKKRLVELLDAIIEEGYNKKTQFICEIRGDAAEIELLRKFKEANFVIIQFGAETTSERLMKVINKRETVEDVVRAIEMTAEVGIKPTATYIFGLPTETREERLETSRIVPTLPLDNARFNTAIPFPGTKLYEIAKSEGNLKIVGDWINFNSNYFVWSDDIPYVAENINKDELLFDVMWANLRFYLRWEGLVSMMKSPLSGGGAVSLPKNWYLSPRQTWKVIRLILLLGRRFAVLSFRVFLYKIKIFLHRPTEEVV